MINIKLSVSILSIKDNIKQNIEKLIKNNINYIHLDIMDGEFVSNKTWNIDEAINILPKSKLNLDVHLMVKDLEKYITDFSKLNPEYITFHLEATNEPEKIINLIKKYNIKAGISIKPNTDVNDLLPYLSLIDLVLVMSVEPGSGGQKFIPNSSQKIQQLYDYRMNKNYNFVIEVDGGVNNETIDLCRNCDIVVVGSYITNNDYQDSIENLNLMQK